MQNDELLTGLGVPENAPAFIEKFKGRSSVRFFASIISNLFCEISNLSSIHCNMLASSCAILYVFVLCVKSSDKLLNDLGETGVSCYNFQLNSLFVKSLYFCQRIGLYALIHLIVCITIIICVHSFVYYAFRLSY